MSPHVDSSERRETADATMVAIQSGLLQLLGRWAALCIGESQWALFTVSSNYEPEGGSDERMLPLIYPQVYLKPESWLVTSQTNNWDRQQRLASGSNMYGRLRYDPW